MYSEFAGEQLCECHCISLKFIHGAIIDCVNYSTWFMSSMSMILLKEISATITLHLDCH